MRADQPSAADIRWTLQPEPPPTARPLVTLLADALPTIVDDLAADLLARAALALLELDASQTAYRAALRVAIEHAHEAHDEIRRLERRRDGLIGELRLLVGVAREQAAGLERNAT